MFESFAIVKEDEDLGSGCRARGGAGEEFEFNSVVTEAISDPSASFADLNEEFERGEATSSAETVNPFIASSSNAREVDFSGAIFDASANTSGGSSESEVERREEMLQQELESVDFYIGQGYTDIALDTLEMLERQFASHPAIEARRGKLNEMRGAGEAAIPQTSPANESEYAEAVWDLPVAEPTEATAATHATQEAELPREVAPAHANAVDAAPAPRAFDSGLADIFEEFRVAAEDDETPRTTKRITTWAQLTKRWTCWTRRFASFRRLLPW